MISYKNKIAKYEFKIEQIKNILTGGENDSTVYFIEDIDLNRAIVRAVVISGNNISREFETELVRLFAKSVDEINRPINLLGYKKCDNDVISDELFSIKFSELLLSLFSAGTDSLANVLLAPTANTLFFCILFMNYVISILKNEHILLNYFHNNQSGKDAIYEILKKMAGGRETPQYFSLMINMCYGINDYHKRICRECIKFPEHVGYMYSFVRSNFESEFNKVFGYLLCFHAYYLKDVIERYEIFETKENFDEIEIIGNKINEDHHMYDYFQNNNYSFDDYIIFDQEFDQRQPINYNYICETVSSMQWRYNNLYYLKTKKNDVIITVYKKFLKSIKNIGVYQISFEDFGNNMSNIKNQIFFLDVIPKVTYTTNEFAIVSQSTVFTSRSTNVPNLWEVTMVREGDVITFNDLIGDKIIKKLKTDVNDILEISFMERETLIDLIGKVNEINYNEIKIKIIGQPPNVIPESGEYTIACAIINKTSGIFTHKILGRTLFATKFIDDGIEKIKCYKVMKSTESSNDLMYEMKMIEVFCNVAGGNSDYYGHNLYVKNSTQNEISSWRNINWFNNKFDKNKGSEQIEINTSAYLYYEIVKSRYSGLEPYEYTYYLEDEQDNEQFLKSSLICLDQIAKILKTGYYHASLINLFHNKSDGRVYSFLSDYMVSQTGRYGYGKLSRFYNIGKFSNMRIMGLADFAEMKPKENFDKTGLSDYFKSMNMSTENTFMSEMEKSNLMFKYSTNKQSILELELLLNNFFSYVILLINRRMNLRYTKKLTIDQIDCEWGDLEIFKSKMSDISKETTCLGKILKFVTTRFLMGYTDDFNGEKRRALLELIDDKNVIDFDLAGKQIDYFTSLDYVKDTINIITPNKIYPGCIVNMPKVLNIKQLITENLTSDREHRFSDDVNIIEKLQDLNNIIPRGWGKIIVLSETDQLRGEIDMGWMSSLIFEYENNNNMFNELLIKTKLSDIWYDRFIGSAEKGGIMIILRTSRETIDESTLQEKFWEHMYIYIDGGAANGAFPFMELLKGAHVLMFNTIVLKTGSKNVIDNVSLNNVQVLSTFLRNLMVSYLYINGARYFDLKRGTVGYITSSESELFKLHFSYLTKELTKELTKRINTVQNLSDTNNITHITLLTTIKLIVLFIWKNLLHRLFICLLNSKQFVTKINESKFIEYETNYRVAEDPYYVRNAITSYLKLNKDYDENYHGTIIADNEKIIDLMTHKSNVEDIMRKWDIGYTIKNLKTEKLSKIKKNVIRITTKILETKKEIPTLLKKTLEETVETINTIEAMTSPTSKEELKIKLEDILTHMTEYVKSITEQIASEQDRAIDKYDAKIEQIYKETVEYTIINNVKIKLYDEYKNLFEFIEKIKQPKILNLSPSFIFNSVNSLDTEIHMGNSYKDTISDMNVTDKFNKRMEEMLLLTPPYFNAEDTFGEEFDELINTMYNEFKRKITKMNHVSKKINKRS